eukprot:PhF_6_TR26363/c0_g1_i2/m.37993
MLLLVMVSVCGIAALPRVVHPYRMPPFKPNWNWKNPSPFPSLRLSKTATGTNTKKSVHSYQKRKQSWESSIGHTSSCATTFRFISKCLRRMATATLPHTCV